MLNFFLMFPFDMDWNVCYSSHLFNFYSRFFLSEGWHYEVGTAGTDRVVDVNPLSANIKDYVRQKRTVLSDVLNTGPTAPIIGNVTHAALGVIPIKY